MPNTLKDTVSSMKDARGAELLAALGLERQRSAVESIGPLAVALAVGLFLGAAVALWIAPQSGHVLRRRMKSEANHLIERFGKGKAVSEIRTVPVNKDTLAA